jgi:membrane associated rhomboid family serine protease
VSRRKSSLPSQGRRARAHPTNHARHSTPRISGLYVPYRVQREPSLAQRRRIPSKSPAAHLLFSLYLYSRPSSGAPPYITARMAFRVNIPPVTRGLLLCQVVLSLLYNIARYSQVDFRSVTGSDTLYVPYLTLVPSLSLWYPWVFVTTTLVEQNIFTLLINLATVYYGGKYLERAWGSAEFLKFILVVSLISNVVAFFTYVAWTAITASEIPS